MRDQLLETPDIMIINPYRFGTAAAGISEPLHWWDLNNVTAGQGLLDKGSGSWSNLTNNGAITSAGTGPNGQDVIDIPLTGYLDRSDVAWDGVGNSSSVSAWVKASTLGSSGGYVLSWRGANAAVVRLLNLAITNDTTDFARAGVYDDNSLALLTGAIGTSPIDSLWRHMVFTFEGETISVYVDGELKDSATNVAFTNIESGTAPFAIGAAGWAKDNASTDYQGLMMSPAIWDVALTQAEVDHLYNSGNGRQYGDLTIL